MDDYIKRTDVNRVVAGNRDYCTNEHWYIGAGLVTTIYNELQSIPSSDVEEVRHGKWVPSLLF